MCRTTIGNDLDQVNPSRDLMFYLNTANPATCNGTITSWTVCYYGPTIAATRTAYWATYAVYRKTSASDESNTRYARVSSVFKAVRAVPALTGSSDNTDGPITVRGFNCYNDRLDSGEIPLTIRAGDIIGACVFNPVNRLLVARRPLNIVGQVSVGRDSGNLDRDFLLQMDTNECTIESLPRELVTSQLSVISSRRLHLYIC